MRKNRAGPDGGLRLVLLLLMAAALVFWPGCGGESDDEDTQGQEEVTPDPGDVTADDEEAAAKPDVCKPDCTGRKCGDDGCGGSCGNCFNFEGAKDNSLCQEDGLCGEPAPTCNCLSKTCGVDACGNSCGTCPKGYFCNDGDLCEEDPIQCAWEGFNSSFSSASLEKIEGEPGFTMFAQSLTSQTAPLDAVVIEMDTRPPMTGPTGPGTYDAAFTSFQKGGLWLWMAKGWNGSGSEMVMFPIQGQIEITSLSEDGGQFKATLIDVAMQKGSVNAETGNVTIDEAGPIWCLDGMEFDLEIDVVEFGQYDPNNCVELGSGVTLGHNIRDFEIQNCKGEWVNLHEKCGKGKAVWIVATAGW